VSFGSSRSRRLVQKLLDTPSYIGRKRKFRKERHRNLFEAYSEGGLEENTDKTKFMVLSRHQNVGQSNNLMTAKNPLKMWDS